LSFSIVGMIGLYLKVKEIDAAKSAQPGDYTILLGLAVLVGSGIATFAVGVSQISYWFPQVEQGKVLGIFGGLGNLAPAVVSLILPHALKNLGLPTTYLVWLFVVLAATLAYFLLGYDAWYLQLSSKVGAAQARDLAATEYGEELYPSDSVSEALTAAARNWKTWLLMMIYFTCFGGMVALTVWGPTYWHGFHGLVPTEAGKLVALFGVTASLLRIGGGFLADNFSGELTCCGAGITVALGALLLIGTTDTSPAIAGIIIIAAGMGIGNGAVFKLIPTYVPEAIGGATGWIGGLGTFGGFALPPILASFVQRQGTAGYQQAFLTFVVLGIMVGVISLILIRSHDAEESSEEDETTDEECMSGEDMKAAMVSMAGVVSTIKNAV